MLVVKRRTLLHRGSRAPHSSDELRKGPGVPSQPGRSTSQTSKDWRTRPSGSDVIPAVMNSGTASNHPNHYYPVACSYTWELVCTAVIGHLLKEDPGFMDAVSRMAPLLGRVEIS